MGPNQDTFYQAVITTIHNTYGALPSEKIRKKSSQNKKYQSISLDLYAGSQAQLDEIYRALNQIPNVLMIL